MNTISKNMLCGTTVSLALAFTIGSANAGATYGAPRYALSANVSGAQVAYDVRVSATPEEGKPVTVHLVDQNTGSDLSNGRIEVVHAAYLGIKASPMVQNVPHLLSADGRGGFICAGDHHRPGGEVTFRATLPGEDAIWRDFAVKS